MIKMNHFMLVFMGFSDLFAFFQEWGFHFQRDGPPAPMIWVYPNPMMILMTWLIEMSNLKTAHPTTQLFPPLIILHCGILFSLEVVFRLIILQQHTIIKSYTKWILNIRGFGVWLSKNIHIQENFKKKLGF